MPPADRIPTNDRRLPERDRHLVAHSHPPEPVDRTSGLGARDPLALQQTVRRRGWLGSVRRTSPSSAAGAPSVGIGIDLYATAEETQAVAVNDFQVTEKIPNLVDLGDETVTYRGVWIRLGGSYILGGRATPCWLSVGYGDVPGLDQPET
ncbi:MAG: hypothetical protein U0531_18105 [Dehalococcoidia bacterium]